MSSAATEGRTWRGQSADERRDARRARLLDATLEQVGTLGWSATSITGLCAAGGVSPRHFYELWPGREELLLEVYDLLALEVVTAVRAAQAVAPPTVAGQVASGIGAVVDALCRDPRKGRVVLVEVVGVSDALSERRRQVMDAFAGVVAEAHTALAAAGEVRPQPFGALALALVGACNELMSSWLLNDPRPPHEDLVPPLVQVFEAVLRS